VESRPRGRIKQAPEDFVVDEIPAYEPSGTGDHLFIRFEKRGLTTDEVARSIARAVGVDMRDVGIAGMKDKAAVTTQWISVPARAEPKLASFTMDGVRVLEAKRHGNKLKTGHLHGNRFDIVVRDVSSSFVKDVEEAFARIAQEGVPNYFGDQRFGVRGDNVDKARAWLTGKARPPANPRTRRFEFSAVQSAVFNAVLAERVKDATWNVPILGDLLKKEDTGGLFVCTDVQTDRKRAERGEVCPTGPIPGDRMRPPEADALALETRIAAPLLEGIDLQRARSLGEGTRRALRLRVAETLCELMNSQGDSPGEQACAFRVRFVLPKGAYATTVLGAVFDLAERKPTGAGSIQAEELRQEEE
jgi:tRNA pseudouridine13 synthase